MEIKKVKNTPVKGYHWELTISEHNIQYYKTEHDAKRILELYNTINTK